MRRQDIQLLSAARGGDLSARCEAGRRYLLGTNGFPRHPKAGVEYLTHSSVRHSNEAAVTIAECLPLEDLIALRQEDALLRAAKAGSVSAQVKLGIRKCTEHDRMEEGIHWFRRAAASGHRGAIQAFDVLTRPGQNRLIGVLRAVSSFGGVNGLAVAMVAAQEALAERNLPRLASCTQAAMELASPALTSELAMLVASTAQLAEETDGHLSYLGPSHIEASLELRCSEGDAWATYTLGRALCGITCGSLASDTLVTGTNLRKGVALLLRAADAGNADAWMLLYKTFLHSRSSITNPQMARFFLEKAAASGITEARRKLGALLLRASESVAQTERAIFWLHRAACSGDLAAKELLATLVLPVEGSRDEARAVIREVRRENPLIALRLQIARDFGLTKLEALTVDPVVAVRPWGLLVGTNPFVNQPRLAAPRAIPATSEEALDNLRHAAMFFKQAGDDDGRREGDLRHRSRLLKRVLLRHRLDDTMFFAKATSMTLEALRQGSKWAYRARDCLRVALA